MLAPSLFATFLYIFPVNFPIVVPLKDCKSLHKVKIESLGLFTFKNRKVQPVPYQIDDMRRDETYRYDKIKEGGRWEEDERKSGDMEVSRYDELLFYADALEEKGYPLERKGCEIKVEWGTRKGFVYLLPLSHPGCKNVAVYYPEGRMVEGEVLQFGFTDSRYPAVVNLLALPFHGKFVDILDRFKMNLSVSFLFGKLKLEMNEEDIKGDITGYRIGCVRALLRQRFSVRLVEGIKTPWVYRVTKLYKDMGSFPNDIYIPFRPGLVITDAKLRVTLDFNEEVKGSYLWTEKFKDKVLVDGKSSETEEKLNGSPFPSWVALETRFGTLVGIVKVDTKLEMSELKRRFFYRDDESYEDLRGEAKGSIGELGWVIEELKNLKGGMYKLEVIIMGGEKIDVEFTLSEVLQEIKTEVRDLSK